MSIHEAAARLAEYEASIRTERGHDTYHGTAHTLVGDWSALAQFAAKLLDPTLIEESTIRALGKPIRDDGSYLLVELGTLRVFWNHACKYTGAPGYCNAMIGGGRYVPIRTRGQLRLLALGLGIELGE